MTKEQQLNSLLNETVQRETRKAKFSVIKAAMNCLIQQLAAEDTTAAMQIKSVVDDVLTPSD